MEVSRVNTSGERDGFRQRAFQPQPQMHSLSELQPENYRVDVQQFGYPGGVDLKNLESSFGRLSVIDSSVPVLNNRRSNQSSTLDNQGINGGGGGYWGPPNSNAHPDSQQLQRLSFQSDCVNGSYGNAGQTSTSVMFNNGFLNGNPRHVPYLSRNRLSPLDPYGSGINSIWRSNEGLVYNPEPENNGRGTPIWLAKDRISSHQLQKMIAGGTRETIDMVFNSYIFHICELMVDPFGHHVIHKLMEKCTSQQITQILDVLTHHHYRFVKICTDPLGTRAIQSLLRCLQSEDQILRIVEAISVAALTLTKSNNAKHVILQCFTQFSPTQNRKLVEVIAGNCYRIATDQHGCCMLQQCLGLGCEELRQRLIGEIIANALKLCVDCYGNYVVQYVVELEDGHVRKELVKNLVGSFGYLSRNKYGSHAVQKLLKIRDIDSRVIVYDLLREIDTLLLDPFGNYVIQTAWFVSQDDMRHRLMWHIHNNFQLMSCNKFGRKVLEKLNLHNLR